MVVTDEGWRVVEAREDWQAEEEEADVGVMMSSARACSRVQLVPD